VNQSIETVSGAEKAQLSHGEVPETELNEKKGNLYKKIGKFNLINLQIYQIVI